MAHEFRSHPRGSPIQAELFKGGPLTGQQFCGHSPCIYAATIQHVPFDILLTPSHSGCTAAPSRCSR